MTAAAGTIEAIWRYPVKSMLGEEVGASGVGERGLLGDRAYALIDVEDGKVASAKNPRKWGRLFECHAAFETEPVAGGATPPARITFPDGSTMTTGQPGIAEAIAVVTGRPARLATTPPEQPVYEELDADSGEASDAILALGAPGTFFDGTPMHLLTTATLERLAEVYPEGRFEVARFRPNLVVRTPPEARGFVENAWVGKVLAIGEVRLRVVIPCPRCIMTTLPQPGLPGDRGILRTIAQHNMLEIPVLGRKGASVGVYALVTQGGEVSRGDGVQVLEG